MNEETMPVGHSEISMSTYEQRVWDSLSEHWEKRSNRRGLPNWANTAISKGGEFASQAAGKVSDAVPVRVKEPMNRAGEAIAAAALKPAAEAALSLLDLVNDWALELNDPASVVKLARKQGLQIQDVAELRDHEMKVCDRLLTKNVLKWRSAGALEGGTMGLLAMVPIAGIPAALTADIVVVQVLSASIASRIAYSYGYDAKDPEEQAFIQRLVRRSFIAQAAKTQPLHQTAQTAQALSSRVNWSSKLRADHRLAAALEKLLQHLGPKGAHVSVQSVAKVVGKSGPVRGRAHRCRHECHSSWQRRGRCATILPDPLPVRQIWSRNATGLARRRNCRPRIRRG